MSYPYRVMRALALLATAAFLAVPASSADTSADESLVSERLASRTLDVLNGMLGPGRSKVLVEVRGERLQIRTETEIITPIARDGSSGVKEALRLLDLPGYSKERPAAAPGKPAENQAVQPYQKDFEHSLRDAGFEIKKIEATVILDSALTETEARDAAQILPQLLRIDGSRGDMLSIVRAPIRPAWKGAFATPADVQKLSFVAAALVGALIVVLILAAAFVRGARVFAKELTTHRMAGPSGGGDFQMGEPLPELVPGAPMGLVEPGASGEFGSMPAAALGRRFDFLETSDAAGTARILAEEPPADLAQLFAYLAKLSPETASRLFAKLPAEAQAEASAAIMKLKAVDPDRLSEIEDRLKNMVANGLHGSQRLATILSRFPGEERDMLLGRLASRDSGGAQEIENLMFSFEDFGSLGPADLRRIIGAVPYELWGTALRGAPQELVNRVLAELPDGPRALVRDESATPQPKDKVVAARSKILDAFHDLAAKGQIKIGRASCRERV